MLKQCHHCGREVVSSEGSIRRKPRCVVEVAVLKNVRGAEEERRRRAGRSVEIIRHGQIRCEDNGRRSRPFQGIERAEMMIWTNDWCGRMKVSNAHGGPRKKVTTTGRDECPSSVGKCGGLL